MAGDDSYKEIVIRELKKLAEMAAQRDALEVEMDKTQEFINATVNMLSDEDRDKFTDLLDRALERSRTKEASLTSAIRKVLLDARGQYLTVAQVRDRLKNSGFNFSDYTSNPLASVSTTLRRMKGDDVEATEIQGVAAYRSKLQSQGRRRMTGPPMRMPE